MYGYIYLTENLVNHKKYIGQKKSKVFLDSKYLGSGTHLKNAVKKYGAENFKVTMIDTAESKQELNQKEIYYIAKYNAQTDPNFYNISAGGDCGVGGPKFKGHKHSEESKQRISKSCKGNLNGFYGKHHNKDTRKIMSEKRRQRITTDETRAKMSASRKGKKFTEEHKRKISEAQRGHKGNNWGKHISDDVKQKISNTLKNQKWMNNGVICIRVPQEQIQNYLNQGYVLGRLSFKKSSTTIEKVLQEKDL